MGDVEVLDHRLAIGAQGRFEKLANGVVGAEIDNSLASATMSLYGGQVVSWQPTRQVEPVLKVSKLAQFMPGNARRWGLPIYWPGFGAHPPNAKLPAHGYARISPWEVAFVRPLDNGAIEITLALSDNDLCRADWPWAVLLSVCITVGATFGVALTTTNEGDQPLVLSEGLHTYFKVGDVPNISEFGLDGSEYVDLLSDNQRSQQVGPIRFDGELGRIYVNNQAICVIEDPLLLQRIRIEKSGRRSTAVWNSWTLTVSKMEDLGPEGWRDMVCVESANALENQITVAVEASHTIKETYSAENIFQA